jgi:hypothetical protein
MERQVFSSEKMCLVVPVRDFDAEFREIMIGYAAENGRTSAQIEAIIEKSDEYGKVVYDDIAEEIARFYAIRLEDIPAVVQAHELNQGWE